jgi:hypothetical protein
VSRLKTSLPETLAGTVKSTIADWQAGGKMKRLWDGDASLWTGEDESKWLGWGRDSFTPRGRPTKAGRIQQCSCKSLVMMRWNCRSLGRSTRSAL